MGTIERRQHAATYLSVGNVVTPICRALPIRLLGIWAHPDDECYLSAGLMARVVGAGGSVRLICATSGERGTDDPQRFESARFAELRRDSVPNGAVALQCTLDHGELIRKRRALACHGSQTAKLAELVGEPTYFGWWGTESFRRPTASERSSAVGRPRLIGAGT